MFIKNPQYFLAIAREGSISRAAEQLYLSQPYLSQYLARLEKQLGCTLLCRSHTPLRLTPAGELFCAYLKQQRQLDRKLDNDLREMRTERKQVVRVGLAVWRGASLLPDVMPEFIRRYPDAQLVILEAPASQLEGLLSRDEADFCITQMPDYHTEMVYETLLHERVLLVGRRDHPLLAGMHSNLHDLHTIDLRLLEDERFILLPPDWRLGQIIRNAFHGVNVEPRETILTTNITTAVNLVVEGFGFSFIPETGARRSYQLEELALFAVGEPPLSSSLSIVYRKSAFLSPVCRAFIQLAKDCYSTHLEL